MRAFWAEGMLSTHGTDPGLEGPRLPGVEGSEGDRFERVVIWLRITWELASGVCVYNRDEP